MGSKNGFNGSWAISPIHTTHEYDEHMVRFYILGMGAVGSLFGAILHSNGHEVIGLCRGAHFEAIQSNGLIYTNLTGSEKVLPLSKNFQAFQDLQDEKSGFAHLQRQDWILITSKVYSLEYLIRYYSDVIRRHGSLVLAQNGIGNEDIVSKLLPNVRIYRLLTTNGALLKAPGQVRHTGKGYTKIGYPNSNAIPVINEELNALVSCFDNPHLSIELEHHIDLVLWEKIFVNIGINAIASIYNVPNGGLIESKELKTLMRYAITEAWNVAKAMNIEVDSISERYVEFAYSVCEKTKPNRNSMLQDLDKGRKTEIEFINGKIVEYGKSVGVKTPVNEMLTKKIKELESKKKNS